MNHGETRWVYGRGERSDIALLRSIIAQHSCYENSRLLLGIWKIQLVHDDASEQVFRVIPREFLGSLGQHPVAGCAYMTHKDLGGG
jgi:hypothetical protein